MKIFHFFSFQSTTVTLYVFYARPPYARRFLHSSSLRSSLFTLVLLTLVAFYNMMIKMGIILISTEDIIKRKSFCCIKPMSQLSNLLPITFNNSEKAFYAAVCWSWFGDLLLEQNAIKVCFKCLFFREFVDDVFDA